MAPETVHSLRISPAVARREGVVHRLQLRSAGLTDEAIRHRVATRRLHPRWPGVYAVGRAELRREGEWIAAVLTCGECAVLSHMSAAVLWGMGQGELPEIEVSIPSRRRCSRDGILVHRRSLIGPTEVAKHRGIPATTPIRTLIDLAARFRPEPLEAAVNAAVGLKLTTPAQLRRALDEFAHQPGAGVLRKLLDARTFRLTDSALERLFIPIALRVGLARPLTQRRVNGYRVDFFWPDLGLVVETDGGSFHAPHASRPGTGAETKRTPRPALRPCASPTTRSSTIPATSRPCSRGWV